MKKIILIIFACLLGMFLAHECEGQTLSNRAPVTIKGFGYSNFRHEIEARMIGSNFVALQVHLPKIDLNAKQLAVVYNYRARSENGTFIFKSSPLNRATITLPYTNVSKWTVSCEVVFYQITDPNNPNLWVKSGTYETNFVTL